MCLKNCFRKLFCCCAGNETDHNGLSVCFINEVNNNEIFDFFHGLSQKVIRDK